MKRVQDMTALSQQVAIAHQDGHPLRSLRPLTLLLLLFWVLVIGSVTSLHL